MLKFASCRPIAVNDREVTMNGKVVFPHELEPGKEYIIDTETYELREPSDFISFSVGGGDNSSG